MAWVRKNCKARPFSQHLHLSIYHLLLGHFTFSGWGTSPFLLRANLFDSKPHEQFLMELRSNLESSEQEALLQSLSTSSTIREFVKICGSWTPPPPTGSRNSEDGVGPLRLNKVSRWQLIDTQNLGTNHIHDHFSNCRTFTPHQSNLPPPVTHLNFAPTNILAIV